MSIVDNGSVLEKALSQREREILPLLATIQHRKEVARRLCISPKTVESHKYSIMRKLGLTSQAALTLYAVREGIVTP